MADGGATASRLERRMPTAQRLRLYHKLQIAAHRLQTEADRAVQQAAGITAAQSAVLALVARARGEATQRAVAMQLGINESAVTAMTARLIAQGLLERRRDPDDARAWRLALTQGGEAAMKRIARPFGAINARIERRHSDEELALLADMLERIALEFGKASD